MRTLTNYDGWCVVCEKPIFPNEPHWVRYNNKVIYDEVLCDSCYNNIKSENTMEGEE